ncbi:hypothetical protein GCE9029_01637 [Grimontia celer]|uniref:Uncharacterized protein n=2 Tax=Grimontia celer TaxID=1796497 RepID=A0A128F0G3_9GAMM|nr:hypothetical protein GCE9029_01637 [Grimontia celer]
MTLSYKLEPKDLESTLLNEINEIQNDDQTTDKEAINDARSLCSSQSEENKRVRKHFVELLDTPQSNFARGVIGILDSACKVETRLDAEELFIELTKIQREFDTKTCKIWPNSWTEEFYWKTTTSGEYWLTQSDPSGECGIINISTLKQDSTSLWNYESSRVVTNPQGTDGLLQCSEVEERKAKYSWKSQDHLVDCKSIKFGY